MMKFRNATLNEDGSANCEINHPDYGWIPFTARRGDTGAQFDVENVLDEIEADPATVGYAQATAAERAEAAAAALEVERGGMVLSFAQLLIGLVAEGWITEAEGDAWLDGTLPAPFNALIAGLPKEQRFPAKARAKRPSSILRSDPLVVALAAMQGRSPEDLDTFFIKHSLI